MKQFLLKIKEYLLIILAIVFIILTFVGIVFAVIYLKKQKKKLNIKPTFEIVDMKKEDNIDAISESVNIAKDILLRVKE